MIKTPGKQVKIQAASILRTLCLLKRPKPAFLNLDLRFPLTAGVTKSRLNRVEDWKAQRVKLVMAQSHNLGN